ncbi:MAG: SUMF1/EgtB/PvdO family nonheme iron enzyme [Bacteroidota bacterium]
MPSHSFPPVFINYRRRKTRDKALILRWILEQQFGEGVCFLDEASLKAGDKWAPELKTAVSEAEVLLALIHPDWHKDQDEASGDKSLSQPHDWIRQEIGTALATGKTVIPLLLDHAYRAPSGVNSKQLALPKKEWLPEDLHKLFSHQTFELDFKDLTPQRLEGFFDHLNRMLPDTWAQKPQEGATQTTHGYYPGVLAATFDLPKDLRDEPPAADVPFVGLRPFKRQHARLFFGRSREIYELCHKLLQTDAGAGPRLLLLDGYSGTGKSSLLQAGLIPRIEAQGWQVAYARREEDKLKGLPGLLHTKLSELAVDQPKLVILDQVEEVLTNPVLAMPKEIPSLIDDLVNALEADPTLRVILSFRSEFMAYLRQQLDSHEERPAYDDKNTLHALERQGLIEAIRSVSQDPMLNGRGKRYHLRFRPSRSTPERIAQRLLDGKVGPHIAPLLQVNMELLWQRCRREDGVVEITQQAIRGLIEDQGALLTHYLEKIRNQVTIEQVDDQRLLELLHFYVEERPASALRPDQTFHERFGRDSYAPILQQACKDLWLLYSQSNDQESFTRLSHDSLATVIYRRYNSLTQEKVATRGILLFDNLQKQIQEEIYTLEYRTALDTLDQMMTVEERREELYPYFFELTFVWNEINANTTREETERVLQNWLDSGLLQGDVRIQSFDLLTTQPTWIAVRQWLKYLDPSRYHDMQTRYLAPDHNVMVSIEGGEFTMGDTRGQGDAYEKPLRKVYVAPFQLANVPVTWWHYGLFVWTKAGSFPDEIRPLQGVKGDHPAVNLSWWDALLYCNWLSERMGKSPVYEIEQEPTYPDYFQQEDELGFQIRINPQGMGFRLPSEAEWEYAARGGPHQQNFLYAGSDQLEEVGWYSKNSGGEPHPVAQKQPNVLGLSDISGNVYEWCEDDWHDTYKGAPKNGQPWMDHPERAPSRVYRGGDWLSTARSCRVSSRNCRTPGDRNGYLGLRLAR